MSPFTNAGAQFVAFRLGSAVPSFISNVEIGYGSGTALVTNAALVNGSIRENLTGSADFTSARKTGFQADFNSVQMSGLALTEFGLFISGNLGGSSNGAGSCWLREAFGSVVFDGTNELQIVSTIDILTG